MSRYAIYEGKFKCHTCKEEVRTLRMYYETKRLTWLCSTRHLTEVSLNTKKNKRDYERKI
jgi:predicted nucleotidyltransferase